MNDNLDGFLSPFLRRQRMKAAAPFIRGRVLDFGCGVGLVCDTVDATQYAGVDIDARIIEVARSRNPKGRFYTLERMGHLDGELFDTIVGLAIIEHLADPLGFLSDARKRLAPGGKLVLTTPNPALDWAHGLGSRLGVFARESHDEHQSLMNRKQLSDAGSLSGLSMTAFRRFLFGANQLAVFETSTR